MTIAVQGLKPGRKLKTILPKTDNAVMAAIITSCVLFLKVEKIACHGKNGKCGGDERIEAFSEKHYAAKAHKGYDKKIDKP